MPSQFTRVIRIAQLGSSLPRLMPVAASQAIRKGDFLIIDSNGRVAHAAAPNNSVAAATATTNHLLIADQDAASLAQDTLIQIVTADDDTTISIELTTTDSAQAFAQSQVGKGYDIRRMNTGSNAYSLDVNGATSPKLEVIGPDPNYSSSDTWGVVLCRPIVGQWAK